MNCSSCGSYNSADVRFCQNCGKALARDQSTRPPPIALIASAAVAAVLIVGAIGLVLDRANWSGPTVGSPLAGAKVAETPGASATAPAPGSSPVPTARVDAIVTAAPPPSPTAVFTSTPLSPTAAPTSTPMITATSVSALATPTEVPSATPVITVADHAVGRLIVVRQNARGLNDLYRVDWPSKNLVSILPEASVQRWAPAGSRDGAWIAFATGPAQQAQIAMARSDGTQLRTLAQTTPNLALGSPSWTSDGRVAVSGTGTGFWELYGLSLGGGTPQQLTHLSGYDGPRVGAWSPDGTIALTGKQGGVFHVLIQSRDGRTVSVSPADYDSYAPAWSPDGGRLAFQSSVASDTRSVTTVGIVTSMPDGSDLRPIVSVRGQVSARAPAWSPDGRWLAYVSNVNGGIAEDYGDLFVIPATGGSATRLTFDGRTYDWRPAWLK